MSNLRKALSITLIIGMLISIFLVYEHFSPKGSELCHIVSGFDCGIVNKSPYANADGIFYLLTIDFNLNLPLINISEMNVFFDLITSNAFLGLLILLFLFILNNNPHKKILWIKQKDNKKWIIGILIFSVIYGPIYLFAIQHFILYTYCLFCILLDLVLITALIIAIKIKN